MGKIVVSFELCPPSSGHGYIFIGLIGSAAGADMAAISGLFGSSARTISTPSRGSGLPRMSTTFDLVPGVPGSVGLRLWFCLPPAPILTWCVLPFERTQGISMAVGSGACSPFFSSGSESLMRRSAWIDFHRLITPPGQWTSMSASVSSPRPKCRVLGWTER